MTTISAQTALRAGLFQVLAADNELTGLLGTGRLFDAAPRGQAFPYLVLDSLDSAPLLSTPEEGLVHELKLAVYSREPSRDEAVQAAERARDILGYGAITLAGHRFVGLSVGLIASKLLRDGRTFKAELSVRAVTEPAAV